MQESKEVTSKNDNIRSYGRAILGGISIAGLIAIAALVIALVFFPATTMPTLLVLSGSLFSFLSAEVGLGLSILSLIGASAILGGIMGGIGRLCWPKADLTKGAPPVLVDNPAPQIPKKVKAPAPTNYPPIFPQHEVEEVDEAYEAFINRVDNDTPRPKQAPLIKFIKKKLSLLQQELKTMSTEDSTQIQVAYLNQINCNIGHVFFIEKPEDEYEIDSSRTLNMQPNIDGHRFKEHYMQDKLKSQNKSSKIVL